MDIIGKESGLKSIFDLIERVSSKTSNVLISGESGTGKEVIARSLHLSGPRAERPFVAVNCSAIPENLLESELFGHAKGAFTGAVAAKKGLFESADGGTLFLDEIGDMPVLLQTKLLRAIQEKRIRSVGENTDKSIDVRIIAATNKDLRSALKSGDFREDLFYRLCVIPIHVPPLRDRKEDIPLLAHYFLKKFSTTYKSTSTTFTDRAMDKMLHMRWPGNVRELENVLERAVVLGNGQPIDVNDLPVTEEVPAIESFYANNTEDCPTLEELEKRYIKHILDRAQNRKERAAHMLGISRRTLYRKEREFGLLSSLALT